MRPRWPYDMRPSVRAEKYIRDASSWRKDVTDGNDNGTDGQTDGQTDRVRRNMRPPPREEGRIIIIIRAFVRRTMSASELNLRRRLTVLVCWQEPCCHAPVERSLTYVDRLIWTLERTVNDVIFGRLTGRHSACKNKFVRLRWPYDMRPSARAEKYIRDAGP